MSFISLFRTQMRTIRIPTAQSVLKEMTYKGPFDYKRKQANAYRYPFGTNWKAVEDEFEEVKQIRQLEIKEEHVSPFHMIWRYKPMARIPWYEKIVLSRLGLHQKHLNIRVVLPNTPHFNKLLWEVKHLIRLQPVSFPDKIPTDEDIGSIKVNTSTGVLNVNESYRISSERLEKAKSHDIYYGRYLREYLKWSSGMFGKSLPHHEILNYSGDHIEKLRHKMQNANKHQHYLYNTFDKKPY